MQRHVERLMRRVQHMVGVGRTTTPVDDTGPAQRVQMQTHAGITTDSVPLAGLFGFASMPPVGSDVTYLSMSGDSSARVAVSSGHQESRPRNAVPGSSRQYDQAGNSLYFDNAGHPVLTASEGFTIKIGGMIAVFDQKGLTVNGRVIAGFGGDDEVDLQNHEHPTAAPGAPSKPTPGT